MRVFSRTFWSTVSAFCLQFIKLQFLASMNNVTFLDFLIGSVISAFVCGSVHLAFGGTFTPGRGLGWTVVAFYTLTYTIWIVLCCDKKTK